MNSIYQLQRNLQIHRNSAGVRKTSFLGKLPAISKAITDPVLLSFDGALEATVSETELQQVLELLDRLMDKYPDSENQIYLELYGYLSVKLSKKLENPTEIELVRHKHEQKVLLFCLLELTNSRANRR